MWVIGGALAFGAILFGVAGEVDHEDAGTVVMDYEPPQKPDAIMATGKTVFNKCVGCHGRYGGGMGDAPRLAGQNAKYLKNQIKDIRDRKRTNRGVSVMVPIFRGLSEEEIEAVAKYMSKKKLKKDCK